MSRHALRAAPDRQPAGPVLQAKPAGQLSLAKAPGGAGPGACLSFATVPVHGASGLPARLKAGVEQLSGLAMDDVRVHRNSPAPASLGAHAFTRGGDIHVAPGQDQHLPHEAWHVVQQRQGRVLATGSLGGAAVSDDAGLEAEADRMGAQAQAAPASGPATSPARAQAQAGDGVVQAKLMWKGAPVPAASTPPPSPISLTFIERPETFLLRDDLKPEDPTIHVLDTRRKFLLGEQHGSGVWERETGTWPGVTKITEAYKKIPREVEDPTGVLETPYDPQGMTDGRPLESAHPFLFASLLQTQGDLHNLAGALRASPDTPNDWATFLSAAKEHLGEIRILFNNYYKPFQEGFATKLKATLKDPTVVTPRLSMINRVAVRLAGSLGPGGGLDDIGKALAEIDAERSAPRVVRPGFATRQAARIDRQVGVFTDVAKDISSIFPQGTPAQDKTLQDVLGTADPNRRPSPVDAVEPFREASMAETIRGAAAPVMVQLGLAHADRVARLVGPNAISIVFPETLSDVTRQPQPEPAPSPPTGGDAEATRNPRAPSDDVPRRQQLEPIPPRPRGDAEVAPSPGR